MDRMKARREGMGKEGTWKNKWMDGREGGRVRNEGMEERRTKIKMKERKKGVEGEKGGRKGIFD